MDVEIQEGFPVVTVLIKCPEITEEIKRMSSLLHNYGTKLSGTKENQTYLIDRHDVLYFESVDKRCFIYTADDVYETSMKLYEIEEWLASGIFIRSSKSQVVNIKKMKSLCPEFGGRIEAVMENGERLIISRQYAKSLKERLGI